MIKPLLHKFSISKKCYCNEGELININIEKKD